MDALPHHPIGTESTALPPERVYLDFYQLAEAPFAITPDPEFLFTAGSHQQAIDKIMYAIESRMGFILLTGEVGTGKTTVCRTLLDRLNDRAETVYIINPSLSGHELLAGILEDARIAVETKASKKTLIDRLHSHLLSFDPHRPFVVIIDDVQTMPPETLEDLRLLSNLETDKHKLIQVVLSGQPELIDLLADTGLRQLRQRIAVHCSLCALSAVETDAYIAQRLFVAGNQGQVRFTKDATRQVHKASYGIPRLINKICDCALTAGYVKDAHIINGSHVRLARSELKNLDPVPFTKTHRRMGAGVTAMAVILMAVIVVFVLTDSNRLFNHQSSIADLPTADSNVQDTNPLSVSSASSAKQPVPVPDEVIAPSSTPEEPVTSKDPRDKEKNYINPVDKRSLSGEAEQAPTGLSPPSPYAVQLASFSTRENAQQSVDQYHKKGIPAHWQAVNDGKWYRVIAGSFQTLTTAKQYKQIHGLPNAMIINAPLTVKVMPGQSTLSTTDIPDFLFQMGQGCLMETGFSDDNEFYTGLFTSAEDASLVAEKVNASGRFMAQVVER